MVMGHDCAGEVQQQFTGLETNQSRERLQVDTPVRVCCETVAPGGDVAPHCCKPLSSNAELLVRQSSASKDVNTEAEEAAGLEAVTRQAVKTQQTEKT
jgi:hypothetical protein